MSIEGQCHFFTIYFPGLYVLCFTRPRYQVSVYRTIGPLVMISDQLRRSFLRFSIICSMFTRMSKQHFLDINLIVPRLFEEKRRDIVFGFPSFRPSVFPSFRPPNIVGTLCAQLLLQFYADFFETLQMFLSWSEDMHVVWILSSDYFWSLFSQFELSHF